MSSPSVHKLSSSPILNISNGSPYRKNKLRTILEEESYLSRNYPLGNNSLLQTENHSLNYQNRVLNEKIRNYVQENSKFLVENSRLKQENQLLINKAYGNNVFEIDKMNREIMLRDAETQKLRSDVQLLKANYDRNMDHFLLENESLKNQLQALEHQKYVQAEEFKQKYLTIAQEDLNFARKGFSQDITRLVNNYQSTKLLLAQTQLSVKHLTADGQNLMKEYNTNLQKLVSENNLLRNQILETQIKKDNQVKQAQAMKQLEKSRTNGIMTFCKENNAFMEKQISKLAEQLLQKSISIEQFTKDMVKIRRNLEQTQRKCEDRIIKMQIDCNDKIKQIEMVMQKQQKYHKQEMAEAKKKEMELLESISTKEHEHQNLFRENGHHKEIIKQRDQQIENLKVNIERLHEEHAKEMNKVMSDSRLKRKSMKNLSEMSSSLKDLSASGGSQIIKKMLGTNIPPEQQQMENRQLSTVQEQMTASHLVRNDDDEEEDVSMKELVIHYENIILELKNNKALELDTLNKTNEKLNQSLREKQQQLLEILERFSPLMEYKLNSTSIESERKEKIQKHYAANVDLLSVLLDKYKIAVFSTK